ncbi:hypothetical protein [Algibacillus agarilyticus]|uniref:hypothetical protein n=1 Tax=Algibacillus agarilyticus TaxID=2234133 RepID=UPI000DCFE8AC|nr:hypothetical protein [Algibacillus agarilyticus]
MKLIFSSKVLPSKISKLSIITLAIFSLTACGGGGDTTASTPTNNPAPDPDQSTPDNTTPDETTTPTPDEPPATSPDTTPSIPTAGYVIDVNLNVNHIKGEVDSFDRSRYITMHIGATDNEWPDNATAKKFMEDYDVYYGRDNGSTPWQMGRLEGGSVDGIFNDDEMTKNAEQSKTWYKNNTTAHALEDRMGNMMYGGQEFMYPHKEYNTCSANCEGNAWIAGYDEYARFFSEYLTKFFGTGGTTGQKKPKIIEVMNEPFVKSGKLHTTNANITELHKVVADKLHADHPDVKVGGFTAAFPALENNNNNFALFDNTWKTFIDGAGQEMDFYSIHLYDNHDETNHMYRSGSNIEAILDMIEHYSVITIGEAKPWVISEHGFFAPGEKGKGPYSRERDWWNIRSFSSIMMQLMDKPDQILTSMPFSILKAKWAGENGLSDEGHRYSTRLYVLRDELDGSINVQDNGDWIYSDIKKFYELWSEVKGKRIDTKPGDLDLQTDGYVDGKNLYFIVNNLEHENVEFDFNLIDKNNTAIESISTKHVYFDAQAVAPVLEETTLENTATRFTVNANATAIIKVTYAADIMIDEKSVETKYYADKMKQTITSGQDITFNIDAVKATSANGEAVLRLGLGRLHNKSLLPEITFNNTTIEVPDDFRGYDQNTRHSFFGVIEIPVPYSVVKANNTIKVRFSDTGGFVTSATMQVFETTTDLNRFAQ